MPYVINVLCPNVLFPYNRSQISSLVAAGGFFMPPMQPINFEAIFRQRMADAQAEGAAGQGRRFLICRPGSRCFGAGSWGTALAIQLARNSHQVRLLGPRFRSGQPECRHSRVNQRYLPDFPLADNISVHANLEDCLGGAERILVVTPSHAFPETLKLLQPHLKPAIGLAWASKGFEPGSGRLLHEVRRGNSRQQHAAGADYRPIFSPRKSPPVCRPLVTVAANDPEFGEIWAGLLHGSGFRAYYTSDLTGAELGGAVKNRPGRGVRHGRWPGAGRQHAGGPDHPRTGRNHAPGQGDAGRSTHP